MLAGKNVLLGVTGSIAAYKAAYLCRELITQGASVKVLMTPSSVHFISPLTFSTLSKNPVYSTYFDGSTGVWNNHVELAKWADIMIIAPASMNTISKMANGHCDNVLLATYFSMENPVFFAPAMDLDMYQHQSNKDNLKYLQSIGNKMIPAESGELASGLYGEGRMAEPDSILKFISASNSLEGKRVLITAGPTHEAIDPVRYIANHSTGKMGLALAKEAKRRGATVNLMTGPINLAIPKVDQHHKFKSANDLWELCKKHADEADIIIMTAAVADYTVKNVSDKKIKKTEGDNGIKLIPTVDILKELGANKKAGQFIVGFALETDNEKEHAKEKLKRKNADMLILNSLKNPKAGFAHDTNQISIFYPNNKEENFELKSKSLVAVDIFNAIEKNYNE